MLKQIITEVDFHKHLGIYFSNDGIRYNDINHIKEMAWTRIDVMPKLKLMLDGIAFEVIYTVFIRPVSEFGNAIWNNCKPSRKHAFIIWLP